MSKENLEYIDRRNQLLQYQTPPTGEKWGPSEIQNDIIILVERLSKAKALSDTFPDYFSQYACFLYYEHDEYTVVELSETLTVKVINRDRFYDSMKKFFRLLFEKRYFGKAMGLSTQVETAKDIVKFLPRLNPLDIKPFAFRDEKIYSWTKLPFKKPDPTLYKFDKAFAQDVGPDSTLAVNEKVWERVLSLMEIYCEAWLSVLQRARNGQAFVAWMGSLLDLNSSNTQYVYMQGKGNDSKGSILRALRAIFGDELVHWQKIPLFGQGVGRWYQGRLEGKYLAISPETDPKHLAQIEYIGLTGGDDLEIENKGKHPRSAPNYCRFINGGNPLEDLDDSEATRRRLISMHLQTVPVEQRIPHFENKLIAEAEDFFGLAYCVWKNEPNRVQIRQDMSIYQSNYELVNADLIDMIEDVFYITPDAMVKYTAHCANKKDAKDFRHMSSGDFQRYCAKKFPRVSSKKISEVLRRHFKTGDSHPIRDNGVGQLLKCRIGIEPRHSDVNQYTVVAPMWNSETNEKNPVTVPIENPRFQR